MDERIALVTGANRGIGYAIARGLAVAGFQVLVGARSTEPGRAAVEKLVADGHQATYLPLDVADEESVAAAAAEVHRSYGRLDALVNNAAIWLDAAPTPSATPLDVLRRTYETNVFAVVAVTNAFLPLLRRSPAGRIVNLSSELGSLGRITDPASDYHRSAFLAYNTSKTAVNAVTVAYANELWDTPIKVNAADPGACATDMNAEGHRSPEQGAATPVRLASLPADGPSGGFFFDDVPQPW
ncbi:SDR family oxidoreductase [Plantactinospora sp. GCM10030261]|uniref:SDR family oxidoreductase n=1 Tax=Plantactinospora sp. GCM10030261 TaxID=3273420 RepID=UPI0036075F46